MLLHHDGTADVLSRSSLSRLHSYLVRERVSKCDDEFGGERGRAVVGEQGVEQRGRGAVREEIHSSGWYVKAQIVGFRTKTVRLDGAEGRTVIQKE